MFAFWDLNSRQCVDCCFNTLPKNNNQQLSKGNPLFLLLQKNNTKKKLKNKPDKTQGSTSHVEDKNHILYLLKTKHRCPQGIQVSLYKKQIQIQLNQKQLDFSDVYFWRNTLKIFLLFPRRPPHTPHCENNCPIWHVDPKAKAAAITLRLLRLSDPKLTHPDFQGNREV